MSVLHKLKRIKQKDPDRVGPRALGTLKQLGEARKVLFVGSVNTFTLTGILHNHFDVDCEVSFASGREVGMDDFFMGIKFVIAFHDFIPNSNFCRTVILHAIELGIPCMVVKHGNKIDRDVVIK